MRGKEKCKALKEIRKQIAEKNDIEYVVSECTFQGECKGTCPKCEAELRYLERELAVKQGLGKAVAVVGISASVCTSLTACSPGEAVEDFLWEVGRKVGIVEETTGVMPAPTTSGGGTATSIDGDIAMPAPTEEPLQGNIQMHEPTKAPQKEDVQVPETTKMPLVEKVPLVEPSDKSDIIEIEGKVVELITPLPEILEGDVAVVETPLPEVLEGDVAVLVTPIPMREGGTLPAPEEDEEVLMGEIYVPVEGQE